MGFDRLLQIFRYYGIFMFICCGVLMLNAFAYFVIIMGQQKDITELQDRYAEIRQKRTRIVRENEQVRQYNLGKNKIKQFRNHLNTKEDFANRVGELNQFITALGVKVDKMEFEPVGIEDLALWRYETSFTVSGPYSSLKEMIARIQNSANLYCMERLSMEGPKKNEPMSMNIRLATYFSANPDEFVKPEVTEPKKNGHSDKARQRKSAKKQSAKQ